jgi:pyruvate dehydrogenase E1 component alpha subunit
LIRGYLHPYLGEEAIGVGVCAALDDRDYITSTHRGHGHCIARGASLKRMVAEIMGRHDGYCRGRGGSMHIADVSTGNLGANGIVGAGTPIGVGAALATWIRGEDRVTVVFTSDGAVNNGTFGESLNLAAAWNLPVILVIENNQYAVSTPIEQSTRETALYKRGLGYGVESVAVDGNHVLDIYECVEESVAKCRQGQGPVLIEAITYRHLGHHVNDPGNYMPKDKLDHFKAKDPCLLGRKFLREIGGAGEAEVRAIEAQVEHEIEEAVAFAMNSPQPSVQEFLEEVSIYQ